MVNSKHHYSIKSSRIKYVYRNLGNNYQVKKIVQKLSLAKASPSLFLLFLLSLENQDLFWQMYSLFFLPQQRNRTNSNCMYVSSEWRLMGLLSIGMEIVGSSKATMMAVPKKPQGRRKRWSTFSLSWGITRNIQTHQTLVLLCLFFEQEPLRHTTHCAAVWRFDAGHSLLSFQNCDLQKENKIVQEKMESTKALEHFPKISQVFNCDS